MIFISPAEPRAIKNLLPEAMVDNWVEEYGLDFGWVTPFGVAGVQRKQFPSDYLASAMDERLAREVLQMTDVTFKMLILEGIPQWSTTGELQGQYKGGTSLYKLCSQLWSIDYFHRCRHAWTDSISGTVALIQRYYQWTMKEKHSGFCAQIEYPAERDKDGTPVRVDWREWILMHFPGINQVLARNILAIEPEPLRWWNDGKDLTKAKLIGPERAGKLIKALKLQ